MPAAAAAGTADPERGIDTPAQRPWRALRLALAALLLACAAGIALGVHTVYGRPVCVEWFYDRLLIGWLLRHPQAEAVAEPLRVWPWRWRDRTRLDAIGPEAQAEERRWLEAQLATLRRYDREALPEARRLAYDIIEYRLMMRVDAARFPLHPYAATAFTGAPVTVPAFIAVHYPLRGAGDAEDWLARTAAWGDALQQTQRAVEARQAAGLVPPRAALEALIAALEAQLALAPEAHPLALAFAARLAERDAFDAAARAQWQARLHARLAERVYPALRALLALHRDWLPEATGDHGVWTLPDGDAWYDHLVRTHTSTAVGADAWHERALAEVERLRARLPEALDDAGIARGALGERLQRLRAADAAPVAPLEDLDALRTMVAETVARLPPPLAQRVPEVIAQPAWRAPYFPVLSWEPRGPETLDGRIAVDVDALPEVSPPRLRTDLRTLLLQGAARAYLLAQSDQPRLRRWLRHPAWEAGWALEAQAAMAASDGDAAARRTAARLDAELTATALMVVDTGIHRRRWPRARAIEYLQQTLGVARERATLEVDRIIAAPGEALPPAAGWLSLRLLRTQAQTRLGARFDAQAFDAELIRLGPMPLLLLEGRIEAWQAEHWAAPAPND